MGALPINFLISFKPVPEVNFKLELQNVLERSLKWEDPCRVMTIFLDIFFYEKKETYNKDILTICHPFQGLLPIEHEKTVILV